MTVLEYQMIDPFIAGRAMATALIQCRNEGIITAEEFATAKAEGSTQRRGWGTPQEQEAQDALVESFTAAMAQLDK